MSRLRHPIRSITEPFGKAGLTVAILALVLAMVGGAYAAGGLTSQQEKQVKKIAKKFAGKPGVPGANGTNGTNGTAGAKGDPGSPGGPGAPGASVTSAAATTAECNGVAGGVKYTLNATTTKICNGKNGTFSTEPLPPGQTLTGTWGFGPVPTAPGGIVGPVTLLSFPIPLRAAPTPHLINSAGEEVHFGAPPTSQTACPGPAAEPTAEPGNLCVYEQITTHFVSGSDAILPNGKVGADFEYEVTGAEASGSGTWAVTG